MFNSTTIDVVIGLSFIYLVLSLACTSAKELLEGWLRARASNLEHGLAVLLQDPARSGLVSALYNHPLIDGLFPGNYSPDPRRRRQTGTTLPAYIPARNFALALLDLVETDAATATATATAAGAAGASAAGPVLVGVPALRQAILTSPLLEANPAVRQALLGLVRAAGNDVEQVRANVEGWFNSAMDRVSGWYKRHTQVILLGLALAVTVAFNADTFAIGTALVRQQALRDTLVQTVGDLARTEPPPAPGAAAQEQWLEAKVAGLRPLGLPLGWRQYHLQWDAVAWVERVLGWLVTTLALTLGAPFWFDVLNKFMIVRSTIKPHQKSREQEPRA